MTRSTIKIPKDPKHKITIPEEIWDIEKLQYGDYIEIDVGRLEKKQSEFEIFLNRFKDHCRPILWIKIPELRKFDQVLQSVRTNISIIDVDDFYRPNFIIDPEEIKESVNEISKSLSELEGILPEDCKGKHFKDFIYIIDRIVKKAMKQ
jgi:hypothetical protein